MPPAVSPVPVLCSLPAPPPPPPPVATAVADPAADVAAAVAVLASCGDERDMWNPPCCWCCCLARTPPAPLAALPSACCCCPCPCCCCCCPCCLADKAGCAGGGRAPAAAVVATVGSTLPGRLPRLAIAPTVGIEGMTAGMEPNTMLGWAGGSSESGARPAAGPPCCWCCWCCCCCVGPVSRCCCCGGACCCGSPASPASTPGSLCSDCPALERRRLCLPIPLEQLKCCLSLGARSIARCHLAHGCGWRAGEERAQAGMRSKYAPHHTPETSLCRLWAEATSDVRRRTAPGCAAPAAGCRGLEGPAPSRRCSATLSKAILLSQPQCSPQSRARARLGRVSGGRAPTKSASSSCAAP